MTLLAGLELTRRRMLVLRQTRPFADLWIYRREDSVEDAPQEGAQGTEEIRRTIDNRGEKEA